MKSPRLGYVTSRRSLMKGLGMHWIRWVSRVFIALGLVVLVVVFVRSYTAEWTGFGSRTLWDWLGFSAPFFLLLGGYALNRFDKKREELIREQQLQESRSIEADRLERGVIDDYFGYMSDLLSQGLRDSSYGDEIRSVARARTLTALQRVNGDRKGAIIQFLSDARLIGYFNGKETVDAVVKLHKADLGGVKLSGADLRGVDLREAKLSNANLVGTDLREADLRRTFLFGAVLQWTKLDAADLRGACLSEADLYSAKLSEADLGGTDLQWADLCSVEFRETDLSDCYGVTLAQLRRARTLHGAKLPDGMDAANLGNLWSPPETKNTPEPKP